MPFFTHKDGRGRSPNELTEPQILLQSWLVFYDWIFSGEGPSVPDKEILENDQELDDYIQGWKSEMKKKRNEGRKGYDSTGKFYDNSNQNKRVRK